MHHTTVVLADTDDIRRGLLRSVAADAHCLVRDVPTLNEAVAACRSMLPGVILFGCDDRSWDAVIASVWALRALEPRPAVVLVVEHGTEESAMSALRAGVTDYLRYPVDRRDLAESLTRCLGTQISASTVNSRVAPLLVGSSLAMRRVQAYLDCAAQGDANVLITGETGTGKELAAAYLHERSARGRRPLVTVNCAAIPDTLLESELFGHEKGAFTGATASRPGLLETAQGGTIFLDEIGEMGLQAQAKILRALESHEVYRVGGRSRVPLDVRVVAATNQDLEGAVDAGRVRKDLYFRLHVASVAMPPLRERRGDIAELLDHYLREFNARSRWKVSVSDEARRALDDYEWPGNVRELKNLVESLFVCPPAGPVGILDLPEVFLRRLERFCGAGDAERRALLGALFDARWNKSRAAAILECSRMTLYRRMAKYLVVRSDPRAPARRSRKL